jgi:hypothetical protein
MLVMYESSVRKVLISFCYKKSHNLIVLSLLTEAKYFPSGEKAIEKILSLWP